MLKDWSNEVELSEDSPVFLFLYSLSEISVSKSTSAQMFHFKHTHSLPSAPILTTHTHTNMVLLSCFISILLIIFMCPQASLVPLQNPIFISDLSSITKHLD